MKKSLSFSLSYSSLFSPTMTTLTFQFLKNLPGWHQQQHHVAAACTKPSCLLIPLSPYSRFHEIPKQAVATQSCQLIQTWLHSNKIIKIMSPTFSLSASFSSSYGFKKTVKYLTSDNIIRKNLPRVFILLGELVIPWHVVALYVELVIFCHISTVIDCTNTTRTSSFYIGLYR